MSKLSNTTVRFIQGVPFDNNLCTHKVVHQPEPNNLIILIVFPKIERSQNNFQKINWTYGN